jgi:hypothetical protein
MKATMLKITPAERLRSRNNAGRMKGRSVVKV